MSCVRPKAIRRGGKGLNTQKTVEFAEGIHQNEVVFFNFKIYFLQNNIAHNCSNNDNIQCVSQYACKQVTALSSNQKLSDV